MTGDVHATLEAYRWFAAYVMWEDCGLAAWGEPRFATIREQAAKDNDSGDDVGASPFDVWSATEAGQ